MRTSLFRSRGSCFSEPVLWRESCFSAHYSGASGIATTAYGALWLIIAAFNILGRRRQGRLFGVQELPVFLLIFGVRQRRAAVLKWKLL